MVRKIRPTRLAVPSYHTTSRPNRNVSDRSPHCRSPLPLLQLGRRSPQPSQHLLRSPAVECSALVVRESIDCDSISDMLKAFPTPPKQIPMAMAKPEEDTTPIDSLVKVCRSFTTTPAAIRNMLEETRAYGETLLTMDWTKMSAFEKSWRASNEVLLVSIYGRQDTELRDEDVAHVDAIAKQLAAKEVQWLLEIFRDDADIFM
ncbi:hypothetical protein DE146DRAFT_663066, partial [Phaeosphaeria sp. MPI-PUGE-AT-0046c]